MVSSQQRLSAWISKLETLVREGTAQAHKAAHSSDSLTDTALCLRLQDVRELYDDLVAVKAGQDG